MAEEMPALVTSKMPVITPIQPSLSSSESAPCTKGVAETGDRHRCACPRELDQRLVQLEAVEDRTADDEGAHRFARCHLEDVEQIWPTTQIDPPTTKAQR